MVPANRKDLAAFIGGALLAVLAVCLGVWLVRSKMDAPKDSANLPPRPEREEAAPLEPASGRDESTPPEPAGAAVSETPDPATSLDERRFAEIRQEMVEIQIRGRNVRDKRVLAAMRKVPRHRFVPPSLLGAAYEDRPLRIGHGQTISQPYIVALMTELARPHKDAIALDVGTGSGYQAAILAEVSREVYCIEIIESLAEQARERLAGLGYDNLTVRCGDGYRGWPEKAPFDLIIVAAAPDHIPQPLVDQLREGGRLVIPVGRYFQNLMVIEKGAGGKTREWTVASVAFVPMTGEAELKPSD